MYASSVIDVKTKEIIVKVVNSGNSDKNIEIEYSGAKRLARTAAAIQLSNSDLTIYNTIDQPASIVPVEKSVPINSKKLVMSLPPYSFTVIKAKLE